MKKSISILISVFTLLTLTSVSVYAEQAVSSNTAPTPNICKKNTYALCTSAPCIPDPADRTNSIASCKCEVVKAGPNFGFSQCDARAPQLDANNITHLLSTYSFAQAHDQDRGAIPVKAKKVMSCGTGNPWTDCLDMPCVQDPRDPTKAICSCLVKTSGVFVTYGGGCHEETCSNSYWSAATLESFHDGSQALVEYMGLDSSPAEFCKSK